MQVGVDVKCMHTNFGWRGHPGFGDITTFNFGQISLLDHELIELALNVILLVGRP